MQVFILRDSDGENIGAFTSLQKAIARATNLIIDVAINDDGFSVSEAESEARIKIKEKKAVTTVDSAYGEYHIKALDLE